MNLRHTRALPLVAVIILMTLASLAIAPIQNGWNSGLRVLPQLAREETPRFVLDTVLILLAASLTIGLAAYQSFSSRPLRDRYVILILGAAFAMFLNGYLAPGETFPFDGQLHNARTWLVLDALTHGELPIWSTRSYLGYPGELYYGPLFYLTASGVSWMVGDVFLGTKLVAWLLAISSGMAVYLVARERFKTSTPAIVSAVAYTLSFQNHGTILTGGDIPLGFVFLFVPWLYLVLERFIRARMRFWSAAVAAAGLLSLSVVAHIQHGVFLGGTFFITLVWLAGVTLWFGDREKAAAIVKFGLVSLGLTALLTAWFVLPFFMEGNLMLRAHIATVDEIHLDVKDTLLPLVQWSRLLETGWRGCGDCPTLYTGVSVVLLGVMGLPVLLFSRPPRERRADFAGQSYPAIMVLFGILVIVIVTSRYVVPWLFFLSLAVGQAAAYLTSHLRGVWTRMLAPALVVLIIVDLAATLYYPDYGTLDNSDIGAVQAQLDADHNIGRIMPLYPTGYTLWGVTQVIGSGASVPFGGHREASSDVFHHIAVAANEFASDLIDGASDRLSTPAQTLARLFNIAVIWVPLDNDFQSRPPENTFIAVSDVSPAFFAPNLGMGPDLEDYGGVDPYPKEPYEARSIPTAFAETVLAGMNVAPDAPTADAFLLRSDQALEAVAKPARAASADPDVPTFEVTGAAQTPTTVRLEYTAHEPGYVRLAYAYFPYLHLRVDGVETPFYPDAFECIVFPTSPGTHVVELLADVTPLRKVLLIPALIGLALCVLGLVLASRARPAATV